MIIWTIFLDPFDGEIFANNIPGAFGNAVALEEFFVDWVFSKICA